MSAKRKKRPNPPANPQIPTQEQQEIVYQESRHYMEGPIPSPAILEQYNQLIPDAAERILKMAESDMQFQHDINREALMATRGDKKRGQWMGFVLAVISLGLATYLSINGHDVTASIIGGTTVVGLVSAFVIGRITQPATAKEDKQQVNASPSRN